MTVAEIIRRAAGIFATEDVYEESSEPMDLSMAWTEALRRMVRRQRDAVDIFADLAFNYWSDLELSFADVDGDSSAEFVRSMLIEAFEKFESLIKTRIGQAMYAKLANERGLEAVALRGD
ncbi:hypothetical protein HY380_02285 [Candidatus Saccharibacteria bacterium]|nr:hypothetical protein [Candidatus Saccharibacteria bacterium]